MGFDVSVVRATSENIAQIKSLYNLEECSVCEKANAEVFWAIPYSRGAHAKCFKIIEASERDLYQKIDKLFKNDKRNGIQHNAHIKAVIVI